VTNGPFLLDTSTILWSLAGTERLSPAARAALKKSIVLSVVSYWEVVIKARKGLLTVGNPAQWWSRATELLGGTILSVQVAHISALSGLPDIHKDPFDRLLIAQANEERLILLTSDEIVRRYPVKTLW
jgi:PIN domain nuclease of toxin-antitoxin system